LVPHVVPAPMFAPSAQIGPPLRQSTRPCLQTFGFVPHGLPAMHEMHWPLALHTLFAPQLLPASFGAASLHAGAPLEHASAPLLHASGFELHAEPSTQSMHAPLESQTLLVPHMAPAPRSAPSVHTGAPVSQASTPTRQAVALPVQVVPAAQSMHAPVESQTLSVPQLLPAVRWRVPSMHCTPDALHVMEPCRQRFGLLLHETPGMHATHAPLKQIWLLPQPMPSDALTLSVHTAWPRLSHDTTPVLHGAPGLVVHAGPGLQPVTHCPARQLRPASHATPSHATSAQLRSRQAWPTGHWPASQERVRHWPSSHVVLGSQVRLTHAMASHAPPAQTWLLAQSVPAQSLGRHWPAAQVWLAGQPAAQPAAPPPAPPSG
jgi:hypothetical protein